MVTTAVSRKLDEIGLAVNSIQGKLTGIDSVIMDIRSDAKDTRKAIYGNGGLDVGMMGQVKIIEEWRQGQIWFQRVVISALIGEGVGIAILAIYALITITR